MTNILWQDRVDEEVWKQPKEEKMEEDRIILEGCEVGCIPVESELIACPLSEEEVRKCSRRLGYLAGIREVVEWVERHTHKMNTNMYGISLGRAEWQAKLKEWGIE